MHPWGKVNRITAFLRVLVSVDNFGRMRAISTLSWPSHFPRISIVIGLARVERSERETFVPTLTPAIRAQQQWTLMNWNFPRSFMLERGKALMPGRLSTVGRGISQAKVLHGANSSDHWMRLKPKQC